MSTLRAAREAMGTRFEILLLGPESAQLRAVAEEALEEVSSLDRRWSRFCEDSEVSDLNRRAAREPVRVSADLMELLTRARGLWELTGGAFDPALGNLVAHWRFRGNPADINGVDPELARAVATAGMHHVELCASERKVRFLQPGLQLDLGAIGKGYALEIAAEVCRREGVEAGLIHAGTSSVVAIGPVRSAPWKIGIPTVDTARARWTAAALSEEKRAEDLLARVELKDAALGVSAPWGQRPGPAGTHLGHILDARTGRPAAEVLLAVVQASRAADADAVATALVVGGADLQQRLAVSRPDWRSLVVARDAQGGPDRVIDHGITTGR